MPQQYFSNIDRRSFFEGYGGRCVYCRRPITYGESQLDHLLPLSLEGSDKLRDLLFDLGLSESFDLRGDQNIVLACSGCNSIKSSLLLNPGLMAIMLAKAQSHVKAVQELKEKYGRVVTQDKLVLTLIAAYEKGIATPAEVDKLLYNYYGSSSIRINYPLRFTSVPNANVLNRADLADLWDTPLQVWEGSQDGLTLKHEDGRSLEVRTCREYSDALKEGFFALDNATIKMSSIFETSLGVLYALEHSQPAARSFIRDPRIGLCDLQFMSSGLAMIVEAQTDKERSPITECKTLGELREQGYLEILEVSSLSLVFECDGFIVSLFEILRADLDGDDIDEILVAYHFRAVGGTMGAGYSTVLGRKSDNELLNETLFPSLSHVRATVASWRADYNLNRPHSRLGWLTPAEYADTFNPRRDLALRSMASSTPAPVAHPAQMGKTNRQSLRHAG